ncbi:MAG: DUF1761 domain-containing protein [Bacteroidia bacterium]
MNFVAVLVAALIPMIVGMIWYNPKVFGNAWMKSIGVNDAEEMKKGANMALIFGMSFVFALMLALILNPIVIHQMGIESLKQGLPDAQKTGTLTMMVNGEPFEYANLFRTFKHGAFHGVLAGLFIALPIIGTSSLYERRGFKYIAISAGFWIVNMALMGGLICAWA